MVKRAKAPLPVAVLAFLTLAPQVAFAGTIQGVNTATFMTTAVGIFQVILGLFGVAAFVYAGVEYFSHHKILNAVMEAIVGLLLLVIAFNGQALAQNVGLTGAILR